MDNDFELVSLCVEGQAEAWKSFVQKHAPRVRSVIIEICDLLPEVVRAPLDRDQLTLRVFSSLLEDEQRRLRRLGETANVAAWLAMIARRLTLKRTRVSKRYRKLSGEMEAAQIEGVPLRQAIRDEISELPARDQLILELFFFEGLALEDIVQQTGVAESHLKKFLAAGLGRIRAHLAGRH